MQSSLLPEPGDADVASAVESVLLVAGGPVKIAALVTALGVDRPRIDRALEQVRVELTGGIRLQTQGDEVQLVTAPENVECVHRFLGTSRPPSLSRSAAETLTVIAYRQPVTRSEIEAARGVNGDRAVQTLLARGLIEERGTRETLGRPMQYGTTFAFLEYFGLTSLDDLPRLPEESPEESVDAGALGLRVAKRERGPA